jgi:signal transduction histidine kinase
VLINITLNAKDSITDHGKIIFITKNEHIKASSLAKHPGTKPGNYVLLSLEDTGCGMDDETMSKIFEPFFTTKPYGKGTGLGLATVYGIVSQNHGFIKVKSKPGKGTTFRIYFPAIEDKR